MIFTMSVEDAREFALRWLPAWTGNNPQKLASFYCSDAFYSDPFIPKGIHGKTAILEYFTALLAKNPNWIWSQQEAIPMENGFVNKWQAIIPTKHKLVHCSGVCLVQIIDDQIYRNEVYFDRSVLKELTEQVTCTVTTMDSSIA